MHPQSAFAVQRLGGFHGFGIEPATAALAQDLHGHGGAAFEGEDVKMLRNGHDASKGRDGDSGGTLWIAAAIPMFVEGPDGERGLFAQADFANNTRSAFAAHFNHFPIIVVLRQCDSDHAPNLAQRSFIGQDAVPQEAHGGEAWLMGSGPVFKLGTGFDQAVVAPADDLAHARGVAAAANIFQKQGVVEVGELLIGETQFASQAHAQQATAQRVTGNGALGQVKGKGQGGNNFGE
jgi:hypothetical protein